MELDHYLFAFYVFLLLCVIILLSKVMFADVKRQKKRLEELESKLLRAYETLDTATDEFYDLVAASKEEFLARAREIEAELSAGPAAQKSAPGEPPAAPPGRIAAPPAALPIRMHGARRPAPRPPAFAQLYNEVAAKAELPASPLHERVLTLTEDGVPRADIARKLQITQNEVELIVGRYSGK